MNISPVWIEVFGKYGIQAIHWSNIGNPQATDRVIMEWARQNNYIVFTNDLDFSAILASTSISSPSVIQVRNQDLLPSNLESKLIQALEQFQTELNQGALISIDLTRSQPKVRILPL